MQAQLMIFSGRPDPEFTLPSESATELATRITQVVDGTPAGDAPEGGLGYRGFRVLNSDGLAGISEEIQVFRGVVMDTNAGVTRHWVDSAGIEGFLLEQARNAGLGELLSAAGLDPEIA